MLICNKNYQKEFNEKLKEGFFNTYKFLTTIRISYVHAKRVCKDFEIKELGECHISVFKAIHCC